MLDIVHSKNPSLVAISKKNGEATVKALLVEVISDLVSFFNIGKMMNANQVMATAELILEAYPMYKLDDFKLCFKRAKLGQYGTVYDRIDGNVIFDWFDKYIEERNTEFENIRLKEKKQLEADVIPNPNDKPVPMPDYIKEAFAKKVVAHEPVTVLNQSEEQKEINKWMYDFDKLWEQQGSGAGKRLVTIDLGLTQGQKRYEIKRIRDEIDRRAIRGEDKKRLKIELDRRVDMVGIKKMDISEYLQFRNNTKV